MGIGGADGKGGGEENGTKGGMIVVLKKEKKQKKGNVKRKGENTRSLGSLRSKRPMRGNQEDRDRKHGG